ncbi:MAG TPA: hypothetical protein VGL34_05545 [Steroidobacteraceae bacterium]|jgi:acyl-CoA reductase-like NAD-dependent aldehyde dehydrogenase
MSYVSRLTNGLSYHARTVRRLQRSGNGREWGSHGLREYLEAQSIIGAHVA